MLNKRKLHHQFRYLKRVKARYFLITAAAFLALGIYGLRQNNFQMIKLRDAVEVADKQNGDVETALRELRQFVHSHMNTDLSTGNTAIKPPIQLKHRYERLVQAETERVRKANEQVKKTGEKICGQKYPAGGFNSPRVQCVAEYTRVNSEDAREIPSELYKFDFVSPVWSPDLAGFSLLISLIFFAAFIARVTLGWWYSYELKS